MFHEGERAVQSRAGVERVAAQVGRGVLDLIPDEFGQFLRRQPFVILAGRDPGGRVWASPLVGGVGFADDVSVLTVTVSVDVATLPAASRAIAFSV